MKHIAYRFFTIGAYEKEEAWLNRMAAQGMMLTDVWGFRYAFQQDVPGKYIYRLELLNDLPSHPESVSYIQFLQETGVDLVGTFLRWAYFRRPASEGPFELYSDMTSKIRHLRRILLVANILAAFFCLMCIGYSREAWSQYSGYLDWVSRGFDSEAYHIRYVVQSVCYGALAAVFQIIVLPVRRSLRRLKAERKVRE